MQQNYKDQQQIKKNVKRIVITSLCTIPLLFIVGVLLGENINRALRIFIFVLILLVVVGSVEFIHSKLDKKPKKEKPKHEDVFK